MIGIIVCLWAGWMLHKYEDKVCGILRKVINFIKGY